jgi:hypothetical protein
VQGRKSRRRSPDDVEKLIRDNLAEGIHNYFITDDNFARNKDWEIILDRIIHLRETEGLKIGLMIQVDTLCHKIPNFIEKCRRAGVSRVFIGLENINPDNLMAAKKRQNKITEYRRMLLAWKQAGIITYAGYILGFPSDTPETIRRDIGIIQRELPLDILEFFFLTPLPGSEDHQTLFRKGIGMDADLNKYDLEHAVTGHDRMSQADWEGIYREAWSLYYSRDHMMTVMRRAAATGVKTFSILKLLLWFSTSVTLEGVHPLQGGVLRFKDRLDRRPGLPIEPALVFYPREGWRMVSKAARLLTLGFKLNLERRRIEADPARRAFMDQALLPVADDETETLEIFNQNEAARGAVRHAHHVDVLTHGAA